MSKNKLTTLTKTLLAPTLIIAGLAACGYQDGTRTNTYNNTNHSGTNTYGTYSNGYTHGTGANMYGYGANYGTNGYGYNNYGANGANGYGYNNYGANGANGYGYNNYGMNGPNGYGYNNYGMNGPNGYGYNNAHAGAGPGTYRIHTTMLSRVENEAKKVAGVTHATASAQGNDLYINIRGKDGADIKQLERKVHKAVSSVEPSYRIHVTSNNQTQTNMNGNNRNNVNDTGTIMQQIGNNSMTPVG